jgi:hypothetical protein
MAASMGVFLGSSGVETLQDTPWPRTEIKIVPMTTLFGALSGSAAFPPLSRALLWSLLFSGHYSTLLWPLHFSGHWALRVILQLDARAYLDLGQADSS